MDVNTATHIYMRFFPENVSQILVGSKNSNILLSAVLHPAGTSKDSDICDFSKVSDIENSMVVNGKIYIFKHPAYFSKDISEIYI